MGRRNLAEALGASAAAAAMATAGAPWLPVLAGWALGAGFAAAGPRELGEGSRACGWLTALGAVPILTAALLGAEQAFPADSTYPFVSAALLLLLWRALIGQRDSAGTVAGLLGMFLLAALGLVLCFGLRDADWRETLPVAQAWEAILPALGTTVPWWGRSRGEKPARFWGWYGLTAGICLGLSLLTHGTLGGALAETERFPLYRAVQAVQIFGVMERMEAPVAGAVLMGAFCIMLLAAEQIRDTAEQYPEHRRIVSGIFCGGTFLAEGCVRWSGWGRAAWLDRLFWGYLLVYALWIVFVSKFAKKC